MLGYLREISHRRYFVHAASKMTTSNLHTFGLLVPTLWMSGARDDRRALHRVSNEWNERGALVMLT